MRNLILLFLFSSFLACSQGVTPKKKNKKTSGNTQTSVTNIDKKILVEILITQTATYCGGAKPSDELIKRLNTPKPLAGKKLYVKKGEKNSFDSKILLEITSDTAGKIQLQLPVGKYFIVDDAKKEQSVYDGLSTKYAVASNNYSAIDTSCLKKWFTEPNLAFEVKETNPQKLTINFNKNCSWKEIPCIRYKGPLPP